MEIDFASHFYISINFDFKCTVMYNKVLHGQNKTNKKPPKSFKLNLIVDFSEITVGGLFSYILINLVINKFCWLTQTKSPFLLLCYVNNSVLSFLLEEEAMGPLSHEVTEKQISSPSLGGHGLLERVDICFTSSSKLIIEASWQRPQ